MTQKEHALPSRSHEPSRTCRRILFLFGLLVASLATIPWPNSRAGQSQSQQPTDFQHYGIYGPTAPRADVVEPAETALPLSLHPGDRIMFVGNTLLEREQHFGIFESLLHLGFPEHNLIVRNLAWSADTPDLQPRPKNFADLEQHLTHERADVVLAAFGFNESFAGVERIDDFRQSLRQFVAKLKTSAFNGSSAPRIVLISPIANENVDGVAAADLNNARIQAYAVAIRDVAEEQGVGFVDVYNPTLSAMRSASAPLTFNGCHLTEEGYRQFARVLFEGLFTDAAPEFFSQLEDAVVDKNRQYFRRYRPLNTFYYTGDRNKNYGYLDFLPAMRNFDLMVANRDERIWALAAGKTVPDVVDDANLPDLPEPKQGRGANEWMSASEELKSFKIDPRFEVNLFAGEEEFPEIAAPIQMRWDNQGRLWVSCSTTYPHVYPGNEPNDKIVILEDTDGDGRADKSTVFADNLHIPLSFEFGDGGVYVSEMPHLTFLKDTDGDGKADSRQRLLTGFGTEDSHHALHDFVWAPEGDLLFRESIFHHSQVETPYGPVRQANSGWFRFEPESHRLTSFGTYHSTNPWGVTFDGWGQHMASHPVYAAAFHSLDPKYPAQHPKPTGLRAYSGTCGQEFVDFATFPPEMQGQFIKVRYKPTNRVEIHRWKETEFGFDEEYVSDLIFSSNLSFIPVDIRFGPRGALYICDWYNPIKGHAQYSLRDDRRDRHSGRIWRITAKGRPVQDAPQIKNASIVELLELLKRPEYRYRYWARRELRERDSTETRASLDDWLVQLDQEDPDIRRHQLEALWMYRRIGETNTPLLRELLSCEEPMARAAAVRQLRWWHAEVFDATQLLRRAANDDSAIVRMEAAITASYFGTKEALAALLDVFDHPMGGHLAYAVRSSLGSEALQQHWSGDAEFGIARRLARLDRSQLLNEPTPNARQAEFDVQPNLKVVNISCVPERMQFTVKQFAVTTGQPVKVVFSNPDATDHNLVIVKPGALETVGMAANEMAKDPKNANSDFLPQDEQGLILRATPMIGPTKKSLVAVMRFQAPTKPGIYPYVCTFPGHWVVMRGEMIVAEHLEDVESMLAARQPSIVKEWALDDFGELALREDETSVMRGMQAFVKARCDQCHVINGHGVNLGPDLEKISERFRGRKLLRQILEPSAEINEKYQNVHFILESGKVESGVVLKEDDQAFHILKNLLMPNSITKVRKSEIDEKEASSVSPMPDGLLNTLTLEEIVDLVSFLQAGGYKLPDHLQHHTHH